jgi:hypothetical protein
MNMTTVTATTNKTCRRNTNNNYQPYNFTCHSAHAPTPAATTTGKWNASEASAKSKSAVAESTFQ